MKWTEACEVSGPVIAIPIKLVHAIGAKGAIFVTQLFSWQAKEGSADRWICKTQIELEQETGLTRHEQNTCVKNLKEKKVLEVWYDRLNHHCFYRIAVDSLNAIMEADLPGQIRKPDFGKPHSGVPEIRKPDFARENGPKPEQNGADLTSILAESAAIEAPSPSGSPSSLDSPSSPNPLPHPPQAEDKKEKTPKKKEAVASGNEELALNLGSNGKTRHSEAMEAMKVRIGGWFRRRPTTQWSAKELKALRAHLPALEAEIDVLEAMYLDKTQKYNRHDVLTLLNNAPGEIDRARTLAAAHHDRIAAEKRKYFVAPPPPKSDEPYTGFRDAAKMCFQNNK